jgi:cellobiose phosphorylase
MLLALGRWDEARDLLLRVFRQQNSDGDWPQWFMFFDRERDIRPGDSHGDIVFWPLLALAQYLSASEDASILDVALPFYSAAAIAPRTPRCGSTQSGRSASSAHA